MTGTTVSTVTDPPTAAAVAPRPPSPGATSAKIMQAGGRTARRTRAWLREDGRAPAWFVSMVLHTLLLVLLALFTYRRPGRPAIAIEARRVDSSPTFALQVHRRSDDHLNHESALAPEPANVEIAPSVLAPPSPLRKPSNNAVIDDASLAGLGGGPTAADIPLLRLPGGGLSGRTEEAREKLGRRYGATPQSERAVEEGLRWLAEHQRPNGSWSFDLSLDPCNGRCRHSKTGESPTPPTAATGLALLAFLGAGYTHQSGPYTEQVRRGIYYLRSEARESEAGYDLQRGSMYGHGIALMALAEALAMTGDADRRDADLVDLVHRTAWFTVIAQHRNGSWGYVPGSPGDTTLTGWQTLSLLAAKRTGAPLQTDTLRNARGFVLSTSPEKEYSFGYQGPPGEPTTTAIGLTLMLYLGESPDYTPFYNALTRLGERGPLLTNVYHDYYGTLALHHSRHPSWDGWNKKLRDYLIAEQATEGHERGSWHFPDRWGDVGGRLYTTAMSIMILEVYYRYLPLYAEIDEFPL